MTAELPGLFDLAPPPTVEEVLEVAWPENIGHISATSLKTFAACPEQFRRRYLCGEIIPPGPNLLWGRADHAALEHNFSQKVETHADLPVDEVKEVFAATVDSVIEETGGLGELDWSADKTQGIGVQGRKDVIADVKDRGVILAGRYHLDIAPGLQPVVVEEEFELRLAGVPVPIIGRLDLIVDPSEQATAEQRTLAALAAMEGTEEPAEVWGRRIVDRKTSGAKKTKPEPDWSVQAGIYQLARWLPHEWQIGVKTKEPYNIANDPDLLVKASSSRKRWVEKVIRSLVAELGHCYLTYGSEEPWPATRALFHQWRCGYCGYAKSCEWKRG